MKIANVEIKGNAILAPMAGVTDASFRNICYDFGSACAVSEMASAVALVHNPKKTLDLIDLSHDNGPCAIQIFGQDPEIMAEAAKMVASYNPLFIDINMGCPVPKIAGNSCGAALMKTPKLCGEIVSAMKKAVNVPVTCKMRKGWDDTSVNAVEVAKICEDNGADAIFLHGRTRAQMYKPFADWKIIEEVKKSVKVPVIGNGDVIDGQSAKKMMYDTGCDAVLVGRAALGNPFIFANINSVFSDREIEVPEPPLSKKIIIIRKHIESMCNLKGEEKAMRESRKHVSWYFHGVKGAAEFRRRAGQLEKLDDLDELLKDVFIKSLEG